MSSNTSQAEVSKKLPESTMYFTSFVIVNSQMVLISEGTKIDQHPGVPRLYNLEHFLFWRLGYLHPSESRAILDLRGPLAVNALGAH